VYKELLPELVAARALAGLRSEASTSRMTLGLRNRRSQVRILSGPFSSLHAPAAFCSPHARSGLDSLSASSSVCRHSQGLAGVREVFAEPRYLGRDGQRLLQYSSASLSIRESRV
jgi:hypothetical protein